MSDDSILDHLDSAVEKCIQYSSTISLSTTCTALFRKQLLCPVGLYSPFALVTDALILMLSSILPPPAPGEYRSLSLKLFIVPQTDLEPPAEPFITSTDNTWSWMNVIAGWIWTCQDKHILSFFIVFYTLFIRRKTHRIQNVPLVAFPKHIRPPPPYRTRRSLKQNIQTKNIDIKWQTKKLYIAGH